MLLPAGASSWRMPKGPIENP
ncbi:DUF3704 domain-containing protein [bacterium]|nr:DUF3704 domain-containing protein [bacterium]